MELDGEGRKNGDDVHEAPEGTGGSAGQAGGRGGGAEVGAGEASRGGGLASLLRLFRRGAGGGKAKGNRSVSEGDIERLREELERLEEEYERLRREVERKRRLIKGLKERDEKALKEAFELFRDWFEETHEIIAINTLRAAAEKPPVWWQWLMLIAIGVFGGIGLGILISTYLLHGNPIPVQVICR